MSDSARAQFHTVITGSGKTAAGIVVPPDAVEALDHGKRPPVKVTIREHTYRSTVAVMGGQFMIGVSAENRAKAGVGVGDEVEVYLELDLAVRELAVPDDFAAALAQAPAAKHFLDTLSYSRRQWHVLSITGAKTAVTRQRRIEKSLAMLDEGRTQ